MGKAMCEFLCLRSIYVATFSDNLKRTVTYFNGLFSGAIRFLRQNNKHKKRIKRMKIKLTYYRIYAHSSGHIIRFCFYAERLTFWLCKTMPSQRSKQWKNSLEHWSSKKVKAMSPGHFFFFLIAIRVSEPCWNAWNCCKLELYRHDQSQWRPDGKAFAPL